MTRFTAAHGLKVLRLTACFALVWLTGCASAGSSAPSSDEKPHTASSRIIGGYLDTATNGVVALTFQTQNQVAVFCSGSLLAPNLVLTARHCIAQIGDGSSEQVDCTVSRFTAEYDPSFIFVSTDAQPQKSSGRLYPVAQVLEAPGSTAVCGFDVALLVLRGAGIPSAAATPIVPVLNTPTAAQVNFSAVGYGLQNPNDTQGTTAGSRMRFDGAQVYCVGESCPVAAQNQADEWVGNSPVCSGDSGGPALDSKGQVFGVTSRGDAACSYALYSDVADWSDFIRSTAQSAAVAGGYSAPAWATDTTLDAGSTEPDAGGAGGTGNVGVDAGPAAGGVPAGGGTAAGGAATGGTMGGGTPTVTPPSVSATPTVNPLGQACAGDCPGIYQCFSSTGMPPGICVPACGSSGATCPADYTCSSSLAVCVPTKDVKSTAHVSASCALGNGRAPGWAALFAFGCAWLLRRRQRAA